jgi:hypothetical protein
MFGTALLCSALLTADAPAAPASPSPEDLAAYRAAQATVGRDAEAHVRLALWCESHGLLAERRKHLAMATLIDPDHATARGLLGQVPEEGRWRRPEEVAEEVANDPDLSAKLAEYDRKRAAAKDSAEEQWDLALWCEQQGLRGQARAHLLAVVRLDPKREGAWKRLGYAKSRDGRWLTEEQSAAEAAEREAQRQADRHWSPLLARWKGDLAGKDGPRRREADERLASVADPRAVPSIWKVFARGKAGDQSRAVQLLGQVDAIPASRMLSLLAVSGRSAEVRRSAAETLRRRDPREFADLLVNLLRDPIKYEVRPVGGPGSPGALFVEGKRLNLQRTYSPPPAPELPLLPGDLVANDENGLPVVTRYLGYHTSHVPLSTLLGYTGKPYDGSQVAEFLSRTPLGETGRRLGPALADGLNLTPSTPEQQFVRASLEARPGGPFTSFEFTYPAFARIPIGEMAAESQKSAVVAQRQLEDDIRLIERHNAPIIEANERIGQILRDVTGQDLGDDRKAWQVWWSSQLGFQAQRESTGAAPTVVEEVPLAYQPRPIAVNTFLGPIVKAQRYSCFGAGTPIRTRNGLRAIEDLKVGDLVLAQDAASGSLGYQPVVAVHHNPPSPTLRVSLNGADIVSSTFHRIWKAGRGWTMARDLKVGDTIRTLNGTATVTAIEPEKVQPVFNLDVADSHSFFAGPGAALVHDNTVPGLRLEPFDAPMVLAENEAGRDD